MIIAGEASGDMHGSRVVRAMHAIQEGITFCGIGGDALKDAGVRILVDAADLAVVGITEVLTNAGTLLGGISTAKAFLKTGKPDLLILIDFPDFNLRIARAARKLGIPVLYYISPQIWAWRQGRVRKIRKRIDHMAVILPFEAAFYEKAGVPVTFVGHPLLDAGERPDLPTVRKDGEGPPVIGLLPGSRDGEINRHLPVLMASARILHRRMPGVTFLLSAAPAAGKDTMGRISGLSDGIDIRVETGSVQRVFEQAALVIAASGTVTLEAAIAGIPMVVIYKLSSVSAWLVRRLIRVKYVSLANLIADKPIVPELLQGAASPEGIAETAFDILTDPPRSQQMRNDLLNLRDQLGGPGASERVADIALGMIDGR
jgi:lipid-A-disaccharide synthase